MSTVPISIGGIYAGGDRGIIHALDAETGETTWRFDTVASPDLWGNPTVNSGGGAWYPPAIDPGRSLVYWGVANPAPFPGTPEFPNGSSRPGANLYTDSVVALDIATGELRWFDQVHPHDLFDRDLVHTLVARPPGRTEVVVGAGKGAVVVGIDPDTRRASLDHPRGNPPQRRPRGVDRSHRGGARHLRGHPHPAGHRRRRGVRGGGRRSRRAVSPTRRPTSAPSWG